MSTTGTNEERYNFYEDKLWTGRLASFTKSIDSNLKLLRVILLTKGSTIMEFSKVLDKGLLKVNESINDDALSPEFKKSIKKFDDFRSAAVPLAKQILGDSEHDEDLGKLSTIWGSSNRKVQDSKPKDKGGIDIDDIHELVKFKFEETQLFNLRTLSLNQKTFVNNRLKHSVKSTLSKIDISQNSTDGDEIALIRKCFQYIAGDIEIVQRAIVQRVHEVDDNGAYNPSMQASALQITDMLALMALKPFQHLLLSESDITPITFFSQETHIRSLPYCDDVILIGIRYDQVLQDLENDETPPPFELLAIPHEIGHYVYQRANIKAQREFVNKVVREEFNLADWAAAASDESVLHFADVSAKLPLKEERHRQWCEEIFSDICGCIVAGPLVTLSLLSILVARTDADNRNEHGEHPTGVLRPFILQEILLQLNKLKPAQYQFDLAAQDLVETWQTIQEKSGRQETKDYKQDLDEIRKIIRVFAKILLEDGPAELKLWSTTNVNSLSDCATELKNIKTMSGFDGLEPSKLSKTAPEDGADIKRLVEEWKKKGPVTIGDHD